MTTTTSSTSAPGSPSAACATRVAAALTREEKAGQLVWVGWTSGSGASSLSSVVTSTHVGGVFLLGGWSGRDHSTAQIASLQRLAADEHGGRLVVAVDQEGGSVQQLRGSGYSDIPSARGQNAWSAAELTSAATTWAGELKSSGATINLAPVADTVPATLGGDNAPIGAHARNFSSDPADNARMVAAVIKGMHAGGIGATVKHFPGLGRVSSNTDLSSSGTTDAETGPDDAYLQPFAAGIAAGADAVMVSSARYPRIDPANRAVFSRAVITDLLRTKLGYAGVVTTDDVGAARAVSGVDPGARATRFIAAGGDVVLTARTDLAAPMTAAIVSRTAASTDFAGQVDAAVVRVLTLKAQRGLLACG